MPESEETVQESDSLQELDIKFRRPKSYVTSIRLTATESRELTRAARAAHLPLSTYIKEAARKYAALQARISQGTQIVGALSHTVIAWSGPRLQAENGATIVHKDIEPRQFAAPSTR